MKKGIRIDKSLLKKGGDHTRALLSYRSTPLACGYSPAQLLMGRKLRTTLPTVPATLAPKWPNMERLQEKEAESRERIRRIYDERYVTLLQPVLEPEEHVLIKDMGIESTVKQTAGTPRSCLVQAPNGVLRRNRTHLVKLPEENIAATSPKKQDNNQDVQVKPPPSPCIVTRPKRMIKHHSS